MAATNYFLLIPQYFGSEDEIYACLSFEYFSNEKFTCI